jgi:hypothetical protein
MFSSATALEPHRRMVPDVAVAATAVVRRGAADAATATVAVAGRATEVLEDRAAPVAVLAAAVGRRRIRWLRSTPTIGR